jgi:hypothetical protein
MKTTLCLMLAGSAFLLALVPGCGDNPQSNQVIPSPPAPNG